MKPLLPFLCCALLALCACSAQEQIPAASSEAASPLSSSQVPVSSPEAAVTSSEVPSCGSLPSFEASSNSSVPASGAETAGTPALQPGALFALDDAQAPALPQGEPELAGPDALARWEQLLSSGSIARLDARGMAQAGGALSAESAGELLAVLQSARLACYEALGNPPTGGSEAVYAYAADGARLFCALYNGEWLTVQLGDEPLCYIFDGSGSGLDRLGEILAP